MTTIFEIRYSLDRLEHDSNNVIESCSSLQVALKAIIEVTARSDVSRIELWYNNRVELTVILNQLENEWTIRRQS